MENRDITFSNKKFSIPEFSDTLSGSPTKFFVTVRPQIFHRKSWYSPVRHNFSLLPETFWNKEAFLYELIWYCETKQFDGKSLYSPPLLSLFFRYQNFCGTQKGAPMKFFGTSRKHFFYGRSWHNLLKQKIFDTLFWWHTNGSPTKCFATVRQQIFYRKSLYSLLRRKFFRYPKLLKHRSFPLRNDSVLWDKTIWRKIVILASSLIAFFSIPEFFSNTEGVLYEFFTHSETESFDRKTW